MGVFHDDDVEDVGAVPRCRTCGSERVARDAWACWNRELGVWELEHVYDVAHCHECEEETKLEWVRPEVPPNQRIRELNDRFRMRGQGRGTILVTSGVQEYGAPFVLAALSAVRTFNAFTDDNDPWGEHDFGSVEVEGEKVFFKLDYYADENCSAGSENPANEAAAFRVLTIMLACEY